MELNALGFFQALGGKTTKTSSQFDGNNGIFNTLLNVSLTNQSAKTSVKLEMQSEELSGNGLNELLEFMKTSDVLEVEGGRELLDQALLYADTDVLPLIKEYFGFSDQKWSDILQVMSGIQSGKPTALDSLVQQEPDAISDTEIDLNQIEMMVASLLNLPLKEAQITISDDAQAFIKAAKLYDLLANEQDNKQNSQLKGLIKQLAEKIEILSTDNKNPINFELLQKTFSPVAMELNRKMMVGNNQSNELSQLVSKPAGKFEFVQGNAFLDQMASKPEITMMFGGNPKQVLGETFSAQGIHFGKLNISQTNQSAKTSVKMEMQSGELSGNGLNELLEFMKTSDVLEVEGGRELLDQVILNTDTDLLPLIKEYFGFSDQKWSDILQIMLGIQSDKPTALDSVVQQEPDANSKTEIDLKQMEMMVASLFNLPLKDFHITISDDAQGFIKAAKLYELLASNQENNQNSQLKDLIKQLAEKIETLSTDNKNAIKFELLQKTFSPLALELNKKILGVNNQGNALAEPKVLIKQLAERLETPSTDDKKTSDNLELLKAISKNGEVSEPVVKPLAKFEVLQGTTFLGQQVSKPEQITMMADTNRKPVSAEQLMRQFESILSKSSFMKAGGSQRLLIRLNPEHLGSLRIELIQKEQTMIARILTSTGTAKETLETQLKGLKLAFAAQGIPVEKIEISQQLVLQERFLNREQSQQQEQQQKGDHNHEMEKHQKNDEFTLTFEEALLNMEV